MRIRNGLIAITKCREIIISRKDVKKSLKPKSQRRIYLSSIFTMKTGKKSGSRSFALSRVVSR